jgi:hypothetical protein
MICMRLLHCLPALDIHLISYTRQLRHMPRQTQNVNSPPLHCSTGVEVLVIIIIITSSSVFGFGVRISSLGWFFHKGTLII